MRRTRVDDPLKSATSAFIRGLQTASKPWSYFYAPYRMNGDVSGRSIGLFASESMAILSIKCNPALM
jgi:hypothetical protein